MPTEQQQLEAVIVGLEAQRALLGDALVESAAAPIRARLDALAAAQPAGAGEQSLKQVSVLFLDVVGSTALSQHLDPEEVHEVMDGALSSCTTIVESHRGKVLQYAGDSLLAVFGADGAREDDPERAVRAGLALLAEGRHQGEQVAMKYGHRGVDVRVGIHTGGVLLGGGVDAEGSIRGMSVNIAARMEQSAPAGALRISHDTYRHVRGVFDVEPQPPIELKGLDGLIVTYLVVRAKPRAFRVATRGIEGVETHMVGRDAELEQLQAAFRRLYIEPKLAAITVVADAGLGKSRLLYEFSNWAEARAEAFYIFRGRAHPQTQSQPYGLLRDVLAWRFQIADSDSMETAKQKLEQGLAPLFATEGGSDMAQEHAHLLGHLIGIDFGDSKHISGIKEDGKQIRNRGFHAAAQMFRRACASDGVPAVLLLDDLHWADDGSLDFLNYLAQVNRDVPLLVLGLTRPSLFERRTDWRSTEGIHLRIDMLPLDTGFSRLLANELLKHLDEIPSALRELVSSSAEGNPFYMEELVKMLVDEGALQTSGPRWTLVPERLLATRVPQTLTGVLQARLDSLQPAEKLALQQASVIGFVFWDQALAAIDTRATEALPGVTRRELVIPHPEAGLDGVREYAFQHQILHHVTYDTVLKRMRRECHAKAAAWLAGLSGSRANDFLGATAEHFEKAGDDTQACEFLTRAAEHAGGRYAHEAVVGYAARALALLDQGSQPNQLPLRWRLHDVRERTLELQGKRAEQRADIDALLALADALDDNRRRGEAAWRRSDLALRVGDYTAQESAARQTMALAERAGDQVLRLRGQQRLASSLILQGNVAAGMALALEGLAASRALGARRVEALFLNVLAIGASRQDDQMAALEMEQQKLLIDREIGNRRNEAMALNNIGDLWLKIGEHGQARRYLEEGLRLSLDAGDRLAEGNALNNLSLLVLRQGDDARALAHAHAALVVAIAAQGPDVEALVCCSLGNAELALGRHAEAAAAFERAHAAAMSIGYGVWRDAAAGLARVALALGDVGGALRALDPILAHLAGGGTLEGADAPHLIRLSCCQVLARASDPRADELLVASHAELQARAALLSDAALRHGFLNNVPEHRELVRAWEVLAANGRVVGDRS